MNLVISSILLIAAHVLIWFATNSQLIDGYSKKKAFALAIGLSIPITLLSFYATQLGFKALASLWSVRLLAFGLSYLVFPVLTWMLLHESPFTIKTITCVILSFIIVAIQIFIPNT